MSVLKWNQGTVKALFCFYFTQLQWRLSKESKYLFQRPAALCVYHDVSRKQVCLSLGTFSGRFSISEMKPRYNLGFHSGEILLGSWARFSCWERFRLINLHPARTSVSLSATKGLLIFVNLSSVEQSLGWGFLPYSYIECKTFCSGWRCSITYQILLLVE